MLAKLTSKNQLTLPIDLLRQLPLADYFEATVPDGAIVLRPVRVVPAIDLERVRDAVAATDAKAEDVGRAVRWARGKH